MKHTVLSLLLAVAAFAVFTGCTAARHSTAPAPKLATFQMHLVLDAPSSDSTEMSIVYKPERPTRKQVLNVQNTVLLDQTALKSAKVEKDNLGQPQIAITFTENGRKRFAEVTRQSVGKRLAIVIDGQLYSAPVIRTEIPGGKAEIVGDFSEQEAQELVAKINSSLSR
jgi:preprotein translocase subunit SecD